jgi:hypothetical protein
MNQAAVDDAERRAGTAAAIGLARPLGDTRLD